LALLGLGRCRFESTKWAKADIDRVAVTNRDFMSTRPSWLARYNVLDHSDDREVLEIMLPASHAERAGGSSVSCAFDPPSEMGP